MLSVRDGQNVRFAGTDYVAYDLTQSLSNETADVEPIPHRIEYTDHRATIDLSIRRFGLGADYWREGLGWSQETVHLSTHSGTHVDAPYHYAPVSGGMPARTIDEVPLQWFFGDGVMLDMRDVEKEKGIVEDDVRRKLDDVGHKLRSGDIVLIYTGAAKLFGTAGYDQTHVGMRESATKYLVDAGVKLIGIDAWGFDRPLDLMVRDALAGDRSQLWEAHYYGAINEYSQIEKLVRLDTLPVSTGFLVVALPVKIFRASAAWARVVALVPRK
jgi:kynurenine formamidase